MKKIMFVLAMCAAVISVSAQDVRYVTESGAGNKNGSSWGDASADIQLMIDELEQVGGGQVWVAEGTYYPIYHYGGTENLEPIIPPPPGTDPQYEEIPFPFAPDKEVSFVLKYNVEVYGGFNGSESELQERDWKQYVTILDGYSQVYHVVISVGDVGSACLDGFHITGGNAFTMQFLPLGGELYYTNFGTHNLWGTNLMLNNENGGGIYLLVSSPRLANLDIYFNQAGNYGGGIAMRESSSELSNIRIHKNISGRHGGGMFINVSDPVLDNINIYENQSMYGGGVYDEVSGTLYRNVTIANNNADDYGGGMHIVASNSILVDVLINDNVLSGEYGGGIYSLRNDITMINMTIVNNITPNGMYSGVYNYMNPINIYNSIVYSNQGVNTVDDISTTSNFENCLIQDMLPPGNNLDGYNVIPDFVDPNNDYHLMPYSQCIDFGDQSYVNPYTQVDLDGNPRVIGGEVDLGVYEHQEGSSPIARQQQKSLAENSILLETSLEDMALSMYPNPVYSGEEINIYLGNRSFEYDKQVDVKLFSVEGKLVYNKICPNGNARIILPELEQGMYLFTLQTEDGILYNQKLIINK
jgi:hypothetical protein